MYLTCSFDIVCFDRTLNCTLVWLISATTTSTTTPAATTTTTTTTQQRECFVTWFGNKSSRQCCTISQMPASPPIKSSCSLPVWHVKITRIRCLSIRVKIGVAWIEFLTAHVNKNWCKFTATTTTTTPLATTTTTAAGLCTNETCWCHFLVWFQLASDFGKQASLTIHK